MKTFFLFQALLVSLLTNAQPNCSAPSTGFTPLNDLGTGFSPVTGLMGGLYPNGSNFLPLAHKTSGLQMASEVLCRDTSGNPDAVYGKIVWLSIGMSNCTQETQQFIPLANAFAGKNPNLTLVDGAQGGQTAQIISSPWNAGYANFWTTVNTRLSNASVTASQVQVIWLKEATPAGTSPVQTYYDSLVVQFKRIAIELKTRFPNVKLCYMASRISARYATTTLNPEPYSYWTGWAIKKVIEAQINGEAQLMHSGSGAVAPWLGWGIYMWSDGSTPQVTNPNVFFTCPTDFQNDGTHPSTAGAAKVGGLLLDFFSTDSTCTPWFLGTGCPTTAGVSENIIENETIIFPNPSAGIVYLTGITNEKIYVYNSLGEIILKSKATNTLDISAIPSGLYFVQITYNSGQIIKTTKIIKE